MKSLYLQFLLTGLLLSTSAVATPTCDFKMYWGHGKTDDPKISIHDDMLREMAKKDVCVVGMGCYLYQDSGNLKGQIESYGSNGAWMMDLRPNYNGELNPIMSYDQLPAGILKLKKNVDYKKLYKFDDSILSPTEKTYKKKLNQINSVGFFNLTEHNWTTLLLSAMENSTPSAERSKSCQKINISFDCQYEGKEEKEWKRRIKMATSTNIKDRQGKSIKREVKECGTVYDHISRKNVTIYSVPMKCDYKYSFDKKALEEIYSNCQGHFQKIATNDYTSTVSTMDEKVSTTSRSSTKSTSKKRKPQKTPITISK